LLIDEVVLIDGASFEEELIEVCSLLRKSNNSLSRVIIYVNIPIIIIRNKHVSIVRTYPHVLQNPENIQSKSYDININIGIYIIPNNNENKPTIGLVLKAKITINTYVIIYNKNTINAAYVLKNEPWYKV
jgi:hypothetical protein